MTQASRPKRLYIDMDGVLTDFNTGYEQIFGRKPQEFEDIDWKKVRTCENFFLKLPPKSDLKDLWNYVAPYKPLVLTGVPPSIQEEAEENKRSWIAEWLGSSVEILCCRSCDKHMYCQPGDILVDDWEKYKDRWVAKGGIWITHVDAKTTIRELRQLNL
jgi:hypothetical protein